MSEYDYENSKLLNLTTDIILNRIRWIEKDYLTILFSCDKRHLDDDHAASASSETMLFLIILLLIAKVESVEFKRPAKRREETVPTKTIINV